MVIRVTVHGSAREHKIRHIYQVSRPNNPAAR
jgi:hypothetical protein